MYVINTGVFFNLAWKVLSIMISEKTKRNIKILGKNYIEQLQADVNIILERDLLKINIFVLLILSRFQLRTYRNSWEESVLA